MSSEAGQPGFPWAQMMAFGLGRLRLSPDQFWAMTPRELAAAMSAFAPQIAAPARDDLARMMQRFPDRKEDLT